MENLWNFHHIIFFFLYLQAWLFKSNGISILKSIFFLSFIINLKVEFDNQPAPPLPPPSSQWLSNMIPNPTPLFEYCSLGLQQF